MTLLSEKQEEDGPAADFGKHSNSHDLENQKDPVRQDGPDQLAYIDPELERRVVRKIDLHLMPLVMALYLLAYLDRSNIGNARIAGMDSDLDLDSKSYEWLLTIFYISYIVFKPLALMYKAAGDLRTLQSATYSWGGMMAARFFLGAFDASFAPGITYLLSFFYLRNELGLRCGLYLSAAPLATCFAGALACGITSGHPHGISSWRLLFLVEGLPVLVAAAVTWFFRPDSPKKAKFLAKEELVVARARAVRQAGKEEAVRVHRINWKEVWGAMCDLKNWATALMYFSCNVSFSSLPVFLPTILDDMRFSSIDAQGLSAPPYFLAFLAVLLSTWIADRTSQRGYTILLLSLLGAAGYIMLAVSTTTGVRYAGVFLAAAGVFPSIGNILPWAMNNQGIDTRRGTGIAMINVVGQCGPLLGTRLYPTSEQPYYRKGMWVCAAFMLFNGALALSLRFLLVWENKKLDEKFGSVETQKTEVESVGEENSGPRFRYVL